MKKILCVLCLLFLAGCQFNPPAPTTLPPSPIPATDGALQPTGTTQPSPSLSSSLSPRLSSSPNPSPTPRPNPGPSPSPSPTPIRFISGAGQPFGSAPLPQSSQSVYPQALDRLPLDEDRIANPEVTYGLSGDQRYFLLQNGFVVIPSGDEYFKFIRRSVSTVNGQPYYLTTDAAYHALHVAYNELLPALESELLHPQLILLLKALYAQTSAAASQAANSDFAADAVLARDYAALALKLLDPGQTLEPGVEQRLAPQLAQIYQQGGKQPSALIPNLNDDYSAYIPTGHYNASPGLQAYFRGMTWLSRAVLPLRTAALLTLSLRDADANGRPAWQVWAEIHEILDYLAGPRLNPGPLELNDLLERTYGSAYRLADPADSERWRLFLSNARGFAAGIDTPPGGSNWSLLGLHFSLEAQILQQLALPGPQGPKFPSGLELAAAFDSSAAQQYLSVTGTIRPPGFAARLEGIDLNWLTHFGSTWLYAFISQFPGKDSRFPPFMRSTAWAYKDITSTLGSWVEMKDDTLFPAPPPAAPAPPAANPPPASPPAPGYVEPEPDVFYRLAYASQTLCNGLEQRNAALLAVADPASPISFQESFKQLCHLSQQFELYAQIAEKELRGQPLDSADYGVIQSCLERKECLDQAEYSLNTPEPDPLPGVAEVAVFGGKVLQAGTGLLNRIYVAVPLEGKLEIAQGGVFSYYEFQQPLSSRLNDESWRARLDSAPPSLAGWQLKYLVPGGAPFRFLAFRVGDVYRVGPRGYVPTVRLYAGPARDAQILAQLRSDDFFEITGGPVLNGTQRWWQIRPSLSPNDFPSGWILENQTSFVRSNN